ncbi:MAG: hypothetical protein QOI55_2811, partial [Actinomycetota bacterium]|nr:hypothetical protein [Actinomycetota bacterium]
MARRVDVGKEGEDLEVIDVGAGAGPAAGASSGTHRADLDDSDDADRADDRPERRRRRWLVLALTVGTVIALIAGVTVAHRGKPARDVTLATPSTLADGSTPASVGPPPAIGPTLRGLRIGSFVVASSDGVLLVDPHRTASQRITPTTSEDATVIDRNGNVVVVADGDERFVVDLSGKRATLARRDVTVFRGTATDQFWIARGRTLQSAFGRAAYTLPNGYRAIAQVDGGFLVRAAIGDRLEVWTPGGGSKPRRLPGHAEHIVAVRSDRVAWTGPDCGALRCSMHLTDVASGAEVLLGLPIAPVGPDENRLGDIGGRFSPDGRYLAVLTPNRNGAAGAVALVDLRTGEGHALGMLYGGVITARQDDVVARALSFDWSADGAWLIATEPGDSGTSSRLARIDPKTARKTISGDALPITTSLVSVGSATAKQSSPPLPVPRPLLGERSGITLAAVVGNVVERLDLDTGSMTKTTIGPPSDAIPGGNGTVDPLLLPMADGAVLTNELGSWWVPRHGIIRPLDNSGTNIVLGESRERAWIVRGGGGDINQQVSDHATLVPVDGHTGGLGLPINVFTQPAGAVSNGFVETVPATLDHAATLDVWDPGTGEHHSIGIGPQVNPAVIGAAGDYVLWNSDCIAGAPAVCGTNVSNVVTGATRNYGSWGERTFSLAPDGHAVIFAPVTG